MLNSIKAEVYKARKNKITYVCTILVILAAVWLVWKDTKVTAAPDEIADWSRTTILITNVFMSIASGFILTFLIQREYEDKTIINVLTAPVSRTRFILSKLCMWLIWYMITLAFCVVIFSVGGRMIYQERFNLNEGKELVCMLVKTRMLAWAAETPLLILAVLQKRMFYPSIMGAIAITGIEMFSVLVPIRIGCRIPWIAANVCGMGAAGEYDMAAKATILITAILGVAGSCFVIQRQNQ